MCFPEGEGLYMMSSKIGAAKVIQVKCSPTLWPALGWKENVHPTQDRRDLRTSLVETPWASGPQPVKFQLVYDSTPQ
jgi:hypothetical protein